MQQAFITDRRNGGRLRQGRPRSGTSVQSSGPPRMGVVGSDAPRSSSPGLRGCCHGLVRARYRRVALLHSRVFRVPCSAASRCRVDRAGLPATHRLKSAPRRARHDPAHTAPDVTLCQRGSAPRGR